MIGLRSSRSSVGIAILQGSILLVAVLCATTASSQILTLAPQCGIAGTTVVQVTGSGWAEPQPICEYLFYFDGAEVAARQPDGLYGPPNSSFTIPAGAAIGCHIVKVELRLTSGGQLLQCRQDTIRVVAAQANPWTVTLGADSSSIHIEFDPTNVCDIGACDAIYFVQTRMCSGTRNDGTTRRVTYTEQGWAHAASIDSDFTAAGIAIDRIYGKPVPYYGQPGGASVVGKSGKRPKVATMDDQPSRPDDAYPAAADTIVRLTISFEVDVFCGSGAGQGTWMGRLTWSWTRAKGAAGGGLGKITTGTGTRDQPTQNLLDALNLWDTRHNFNLPMPGPPGRGGQQCE